MATTLSHNADPKWTDTLIKLVQDKRRRSRAARRRWASRAADRERQGDAAARRRAEPGWTRSRARSSCRRCVMARRRQWPGPGAQDRQPRQAGHREIPDLDKVIFRGCSRISKIRAGATRSTRTSRATPSRTGNSKPRCAHGGDRRRARGCRKVLGWRMGQDPMKLYNTTSTGRSCDATTTSACTPRGCWPISRSSTPRSATTCSRSPSPACSRGSTPRTSRSPTRKACASSRSSGRKRRSRCC